MKRRPILLPLLLSCLLLTACAGGGGGGDPEEEALSLRTRYLAMTACAGTASVTADYGERVYDYVLEFSWLRAGGLTVTVQEPEIVRGVTARLTEEGGTLEYDGAILETGPLGGDGLTPLSALPVLLSDLQERYLAECAYTELDGVSALSLTCRDPEGSAGTGSETVLWLDRATGALLQGECYEDGRRVIFCRFDSFTFDG